jgi:phospholipase/carboxylesterase
MRFATRSEAHPIAIVKARPGSPRQSGAAGLRHLRIRDKREALLYVPKGATGHPSPLAIMLHGAGGNADQGIGLLREYVEQARVILLAPESRKSSWDIISEAQYGPDVRFIDECLAQVFAEYAVDPERVALGGFSDGASYALSLGLSNGALFRYILAFSPGFMAPVRIEDQPRIFISHGTHDTVLPIGPCSRKVVRLLRSHQLPVTYREFDGPHTVPPQIKEEAMAFFLS